MSSALCDVVFFIVGKYKIEMFEQKLLHLPQFSSNKTVKKNTDLTLSNQIIWCLRQPCYFGTCRS